MREAQYSTQQASSHNGKRCPDTTKGMALDGCDFSALYMNPACEIPSVQHADKISSLGSIQNKLETSSRSLRRELDTQHADPLAMLGSWAREQHEEDDEDRYVVRIYPSDYHHYYHGEDYYATKADHVLLKNYPRSSIRFVTLPYEADQYHPKAFRHHIEIKDEIFPEQWKNKEFKE